jgi:phosphoglycerate dehydrogenase-like enzyme
MGYRLPMRRARFNVTGRESSVVVIGLGNIASKLAKRWKARWPVIWQMATCVPWR